MQRGRKVKKVVPANSEIKLTGLSDYVDYVWVVLLASQIQV